MRAYLVLHIQLCSIIYNGEKSEIIQVFIDRSMVGKMSEYHTDIMRKKGKLIN